MIGLIIKRFKSYLKDRAATIMIAFALMAPVMVTAAGMSMDYAMAYLVKQRMAQAIDAAALAAGASSTDADEIEQLVKEFFEANYPSDKLGVTFKPEVDVDGNIIDVAGYAYYQTMFLRLIGIDKIEVEAKTTVERAVQGIEVVLVMDNTGSMSSNNNIGTLRTAATNFIYIMYGIDADEVSDVAVSDLDDYATNNRDYIKIGLVPYSTSVNVGPYGLGENPDGSYYDVPFVNNPNNLNYTTNYNSNNDWLGCVLAEGYPDDTLDIEGPWDMYRYCRDPQNDNEVVCDYYWQEVCSGSWWNRTCEYQKVARRKPNYICPATPLTPLSTSPAQLKASIDTMSANGHTYGNYGMVWGYRVLSPEYPFEEASPWNSEYYKKAVVMMTDGINTMHPNYSAYGPTSDHNINTTDLNNRFADVCENLKDHGVLVYTITFTSGVNESTKDYYRECATSEEYYHDAPSQNDLVNVFEQISRELSNLRIVY